MCILSTHILKYIIFLYIYLYLNINICKYIYLNIKICIYLYRFILKYKYIFILKIYILLWKHFSHRFLFINQIIRALKVDALSPILAIICPSSVLIKTQYLVFVNLNFHLISFPNFSSSF